MYSQGNDSGVRRLRETFGKILLSILISSVASAAVVGSGIHPQGPAIHHRASSADADQGTETTASGPGKLFGRGSVTLPVAAHSVPRSMTDWKPTHFIE